MRSRTRRKFSGGKKSQGGWPVIKILSAARFNSDVQRIPPFFDGSVESVTKLCLTSNVFVCVFGGVYTRVCLCVGMGGWMHACESERACLCVS